jgi:glycosyltransferase involved in cell wall biosynthesis
VSDPTASIVITTYATPTPLLEIGMASVLDQTRDDLELVLVVDGDLSPESEELVAKVQRQDARLRVVRPGRVGRAKALNVGIAAARGPFVGIQDADDASHPRRLEVQVGLLERLPRLSVVGAGAHITTSLTETPTWPVDPERPRLRPIGRAVLRSNPIIHSSALSRRTAIDAVGGYDEARRAQFDYDLWLRMDREGLLLGHCDVPLVLHRRHGRQFFEGLGPVRRAWSSCTLQVSHIGRLPPAERVGYYAIAAGRLGYQVVRGVAWHRASRHL